MKLWIDLETTGLKPFEGDQILEVGWFIADGLEMQTSPSVKASYAYQSYLGPLSTTTRSSLRCTRIMGCLRT